MANERTTNDYDGVQHGIDDNPHDDAKKGAALGGLGGAAVGAAAGSMTGPVGAVIGAVVGGVAGAVASGAAVAAVDEYDDDDTVSGIGHVDEDEDNITRETTYADRDTITDTYGNVHPTTTTGSVTPGTYTGSSTYGTTASGMTGTTSDPYRDTLLDRDMDSASDVLPGNDVPGIQTGGRAIDGTPDTRGISEKMADAVTGDHIDDKTGKYVP